MNFLPSSPFRRAILNTQHGGQTLIVLVDELINPCTDRKTSQASESPAEKLSSMTTLGAYHEVLLLQTKGQHDYALGAEMVGRFDILFRKVSK